MNPTFHSEIEKPHFATTEETVSILQPATSDTPTLSELTIEDNDFLKCNSEFQVTIEYYFIDEIIDDFNTDIVYIVSIYTLCDLLNSIDGLCSGQFLIPMLWVCVRFYPEE